MKNRYFLFLILLTRALAGCSGDNNPPPPDKAELLAKKWLLDKVEDSSTSPPTQIAQSACAEKSYYHFIEGGTFISETFYTDPNTNTCVSNVFTGTYEFTADMDKVIWNIGNPPEIYTMSIINLTETALVFTISAEPHIHLFWQRETNL